MINERLHKGTISLWEMELGFFVSDEHCYLRTNAIATKS